MIWKTTENSNAASERSLFPTAAKKQTVFLFIPGLASVRSGRPKNDENSHSDVFCPDFSTRQSWPPRRNTKWLRNLSRCRFSYLSLFLCDPVCDFFLFRLCFFQRIFGGFKNNVVNWLFLWWRFNSKETRIIFVMIRFEIAGTCRRIVARVAFCATKKSQIQTKKINASQVFRTIIFQSLFTFFAGCGRWGIFSINCF